MTRTPRAYLREIASRTSDAKTAAARANAKRPRPGRRVPCVLGDTADDHRVGTCPACRRAARLRREGRDG